MVSFWWAFVGADGRGSSATAGRVSGTSLPNRSQAALGLLSARPGGARLDAVDMATPRLEFRILGPLTLRVDGAVVHAGGPKQRALLALLLLSANRVLSRERLSRELFADQSPDSAGHAIHNHVSRLRKLVSPRPADEPRLVARPPGYLLRVEPGELDLERFERLASDSREALARGDPAAAAALAPRSRGALDRPAARGSRDRAARAGRGRAARRARLGDGRARGSTPSSRSDAHLALVPELEALIADYPYRERFRAQLMLALYRCSRQAESLDLYRHTRRLLERRARPRAQRRSAEARACDPRAGARPERRGGARRTKSGRLRNPRLPVQGPRAVRGGRRASSSSAARGLSTSSCPGSARRSSS